MFYHSMGGIYKFWIGSESSVFCKLNAVTMPETRLTKKEQKCEAFFKQHKKRNKDYRFVGDN